MAIARLDEVVITLASGDKGQGFNLHSLQGRRSFSTFGKTNLSTFGRGMAVYDSTSPIHRERRSPSVSSTQLQLKDFLNLALSKIALALFNKNMFVRSVTPFSC
ncbi:hypothetical protein Tco_0562002 [Tanacetum coccineum]